LEDVTAFTLFQEIPQQNPEEFRLFFSNENKTIKQYKKTNGNGN
jgi:hypothetical protein